MRKRHVVAAGLAVAAATASTTIGPAGAKPAASQSAEASKDAPLPAFTSPAGTGDELPAVLKGALSDLGQTARATRLAASFDGTDVYVSLVDRNGYGMCLQLLEPDTVGTTTCNARSGLSMGWLYLGTEKGVFGLVDGSVSTGQVTGAARRAPIRDGVFFVARTSDGNVASLVRADGSVAGTVPVGPEPRPSDVG